MDSTTQPAARQASSSTYLPVRGLRYHIREWGEPGAPILFLFHGWMDVSASFQFLVDALRERWHIVAPDWRGYGQSARPTDAPGVESYWFADYVADLEAIIDHYQPEGQVTLVGHSLGANVVCLYAGIRPERVRRVVDLEGFGMSASKASQAPRRYARWLDELKDKPRLNTYATVEDVAARLAQFLERDDLAFAALEVLGLEVMQIGDGGLDAVLQLLHRRFGVGELGRRHAAQAFGRQLGRVAGALHLRGQRQHVRRQAGLGQHGRIELARARAGGAPAQLGGQGAQSADENRHAGLIQGIASEGAGGGRLGEKGHRKLGNSWVPISLSYRDEQRNYCGRPSMAGAGGMRRFCVSMQLLSAS